MFTINKNPGEGNLSSTNGNKMAEIPKKELVAAKRKRLDKMIIDAGGNCSLAAFQTKLLNNWENKSSNDPTNNLFRKLVKEFK